MKTYTLLLFALLLFVIYSCEEDVSPPVADFTASTTEIEEGETITFTDQSTNSPTFWSWDFGDGGTGSEQNPSYTYNTLGEYTVTLTVSNNGGLDNETKPNFITVNAAGTAPNAKFIADSDTVTLGTAISFTDQSTNSPTSWIWDFGDGNTSSEQNPSHTYNEVGYYAVILTASNSYGSDSETDHITVQLSVTDFDGNIYKTIQIGDQIWMAENLKVTHYETDGIPIPFVSDSETWGALGDFDKAYCWFQNDINNKDIYGALYTWAAASNGGIVTNTESGYIQGACPDGWHLPSDDEWKELEIYLGMSLAQADSEGWRGTDEGSKLKSNTGWGSGGGTNESGFTALRSGLVSSGGQFTGPFAVFWTSTLEAPTRAWQRLLYIDYETIERFAIQVENGNSVRCVKD